MKVGNIKTGPLKYSLVDQSRIDLMVDSTGSMQGTFPMPNSRDFVVVIRTLDLGEEDHMVLVSGRHDRAKNFKVAASLALAAFAERHGYDVDENGELIPTDDGRGGTTLPIWVEQVYALKR